MTRRWPWGRAASHAEAPETIERKDFVIAPVQYYAARARVKADRILGYEIPINVLAAASARPDKPVNFDHGDVHLVVRVVRDGATESTGA